MSEEDEKKKNTKIHDESDRVDDETVENEKMNDEMVKKEKGDNVKKKRNTSTSPGFKYRPNTLRRQLAVRRPNGIATQLTDSQLETNLRTTHVFTFDGKLTSVKLIS